MAACCAEHPFASRLGTAPCCYRCQAYCLNYWLNCSVAPGRKRWALYPPGRVPPGVEVGIDDEGMPDFQVTAVDFLRFC